MSTIYEDEIMNIVVKKLIKMTLVVLVTCGLLLFFGQKRFENNVYGKYVPGVLGNFIHNVFDLPPFSTLRSWFRIDPSHIEINTEEKMTSYKLELLGKSLNNYFKNLLQETDKLVSHHRISELLKDGVFHVDKVQIKNQFKGYIKNNLDILEVSLYNVNGEKLTSVKYRSVPEYLISEKIIIKLKNEDNIFIKNPANQNLILISAIRDQSQANKSKVIGLVSQTINPIFFSKILDFLSINDELFYIKSPDDEYIVDNYSSYQFIQNKSSSIPYLIYQKLSRSKESKLKLNVDKVNFSIGVIIRENNTAGNIAAFIAFILLLYLGFAIIQLIWKQIDSIKLASESDAKKDDSSIDLGNSYRALKKEKIDDSKKTSPDFSFLKESKSTLEKDDSPIGRKKNNQIVFQKKIALDDREGSKDSAVSFN